MELKKPKDYSNVSIALELFLICRVSAPLDSRACICLKHPHEWEALLWVVRKRQIKPWN